MHGFGNGCGGQVISGCTVKGLRNMKRDSQYYIEDNDYRRKQRSANLTYTLLASIASLCTVNSGFADVKC